MGSHRQFDTIRHPVRSNKMASSIWKTVSAESLYMGWGFNIRGFTLADELQSVSKSVAVSLKWRVDIFKYTKGYETSNFILPI